MSALRNNTFKAAPSTHQTQPPEQPPGIYYARAVTITNVNISNNEKKNPSTTERDLLAAMLRNVDAELEVERAITRELQSQILREDAARSESAPPASPALSATSSVYSDCPTSLPWDEADREDRDVDTGTGTDMTADAQFVDREAHAMAACDQPTNLAHITHHPQVTHPHFSSSCTVGDNDNNNNPRTLAHTTLTHASTLLAHSTSLHSEISAAEKEVEMMAEDVARIRELRKREREEMEGLREVRGVLKGRLGLGGL